MKLGKYMKKKGYKYSAMENGTCCPSDFVKEGRDIMDGCSDIECKKCMKEFKGNKVTDKKLIDEICQTEKSVKGIKVK